MVAAAASALTAGDVRANENIALTGTHTLFAREHNRIVAALPRSLSANERFEIARRIVVRLPPGACSIGSLLSFRSSRPVENRPRIKWTSGR